MIQENVPTVLAYLFTAYGTIEPELLREYKLKVREIAYDIIDPSSPSTKKLKKLNISVMLHETRILYHNL